MFIVSHSKNVSVCIFWRENVRTGVKRRERLCKTIHVIFSNNRLPVQCQKHVMRHETYWISPSWITVWYIRPHQPPNCWLSSAMIRASSIQRSTVLTVEWYMFNVTWVGFLAYIQTKVYQTEESFKNQEHQNHEGTKELSSLRHQVFNKAFICNQEHYIDIY